MIFKKYKLSDDTFSNSMILPDRYVAELMHSKNEITKNTALQHFWLLFEVNKKLKCFTNTTINMVKKSSAAVVILQFRGWNGVSDKFRGFPEHCKEKCFITSAMTCHAKHFICELFYIELVCIYGILLLA